MPVSVWIRRKEGSKPILGRERVARWAMPITIARIFMLVLLERLHFVERQPRELAEPACRRNSDATKTSPILTHRVERLTDV